MASIYGLIVGNLFISKLCFIHIRTLHSLSSIYSFARNCYFESNKLKSFGDIMGSTGAVQPPLTNVWE